MALKPADMTTATIQAGLENEGEEPEHGHKSLEEEFLIAADLTLYNNPVNRYMVAKKVEHTHGPSDSKSEKGDKKESGGDDMIAADLTKYNGPMADFDAAEQEKNTKKDNENDDK